MMRILQIAVAAALVVLTSTVASAQSDSALAVTKNGQKLLRLNTDASLLVGGATDVGTIPATGGGVRLMWFPGRYALRAGSVSGAQWDLSNVGYGSVAFGQDNRASGDQSFATGISTSATGAQSVALGNGATASGDRSLSFNGTASSTGGIALGSGAQSTNDDALAMGPSSIASGLAAVAIGPSIATGAFGVAIGLQNSASGNFSVAIGKNARTANRQGSVVIGDGSAGFSSDSVYATANNQFVARGAGGIVFYSAVNLSSGVQVAPGGGSWSSISDRNRKTNFQIVDGEDLLHRLGDVPVSTWNYKTQATDIRHMGPMAQDLYAAFGLGESNLLINSVDIDGVNLAAAKALITRTDSLGAQVRALTKENAALRSELSDLAARLEQLESKLGAAGQTSTAAKR